MTDWPIRLMLYGAGDAVNGAGALAADIARQISSLGEIATNRYVAAVVQLDASSVPTLRYVLDPAGQQPIERLPDVNCGDPAELVAFANWGAAICPAKRTIFVLSGHGAAWEDALVNEILGVRGLTRSLDAGPPVPGAIHHARRLFGPNLNAEDALTRAVLVDGDSRDYLSNAELGAALESISQTLGGPIDVLVFDACLMSSCEVLQELEGSVSTVVAAIDELSAAGIDLATPIGALSAIGGVGDPTSIATTIAKAFQPKTSFDSCVAVNLASPNWAEAIGRFQAFCARFAPWVALNSDNAEATRAALRTASTSVVQFKSGGLADIAVLAATIAKMPNVPPQALADIAAAAAGLASCVLAGSTGSDYQAATGLSIFTPTSHEVHSTNRPEYARLQFPNLTGWIAVLDAAYGVKRGIANLTGLDGFDIPTLPWTPDRGDAEFVVSLRGIPLDDATRERIEKAIRRAVLEALAFIDILADVTITAPSRLAHMRALTFPFIGQTAGMFVTANVAGLADGLFNLPGLPTRQPAGPPMVQVSGNEFRVVLRGLNLDDATKARIEAAVRAAVLQVVALMDLGSSVRILSPAGDPQSRSILDDITKVILGLILENTPNIKVS